MDQVPLTAPRVLVLTDAERGGAASNAIGHLFEDFIGRLLARYGYVEPRVEDARNTSHGMELDLTVRNRLLTNQRAVIECKAYSSPVKAEFLQQFVGRLTMLRYDDAELQGFFIALPRLVPEGREQARHIMERDTKFRALSADDVVEALREQRIICEAPGGLHLLSDSAVVITTHGVYSAAIELHPKDRTASRVLVWGTGSSVPSPVLQLVSSSEYASGVPVVDASPTASHSQAVQPATEQDIVIVTVNGSASDFEYQLPASPKFFIGRKALLAQLSSGIQGGSSVLVLNAQSGWGKSSLALRLRQVVDNDLDGHALIVDARTASSRQYVTAVLRRAATEAAERGLLQLGEQSWATLASGLRTLAGSRWNAGQGPLVVFFDQFENVFRDAELTREFRDLAIGSAELGGRLVIGFAWKTDLVGWTEGYPYQLRDEIRANATVISLDPLDAKDVDVLLRRLDTALRDRLVPDLRLRLREYSQGLPWLLKKLAAHLIREIAAGATQEQLLSEALNVQNLFDADLAELQPLEREALIYIARFAPVAASDVMDRIAAPIVQSLLNRRLVVQVGERLDTYWDTFRDFLNTGRIPIEDSYILRLGPRSVARLLAVVGEDGVASVPSIASQLGTSENAVFNLSRELRLMGVTAYEPNRVRVSEDIWLAEDRESALRERVATALKRHRAFTVLTQLAERSTEGVTLARYAQELPSAFPAVDVVPSTWLAYARVFVQWLEYGRLVQFVGSTITVAVDFSDHAEVVRLLGVKQPVRANTPFPQGSATPSLLLLVKLAAGESSALPTAERELGVLRDLLRLRAIERTSDDSYRIAVDGLVENGAVNQSALRSLLESRPGCRAALQLLDSNPAATPQVVGEILRAAYHADWAPRTVLGVGKYLRSWARAAGIRTALRPPRGRQETPT